MGVSLEVRVPFLDHRVVEFAATLPISIKAGNGEGKQLLRKVLFKYVPRKLVERPKWGFAPPLAAWLRGPLRPWAEELLNEKRLRSQGILDPAPIRARWREHLTGRRDWNCSLWGVLMFQAWLEHHQSFPQRHLSLTATLAHISPARHAQRCQRSGRLFRSILCAPVWSQSARNIAGSYPRACGSWKSAAALGVRSVSTASSSERDGKASLPTSSIMENAP